MVSFAEVPGNARVPFVYIELDSSAADAGDESFRTLLIGQKLAAGTARANAPVPVGSDAAALFGRDSQLYFMAQAFRRGHPNGALHAIALDDLGAGTAEVKTVTVAGAATAAGTISLYVAGRRVAVAIASGDTATQAAGKISAAINAARDMPLTAAAAAAVVTLTARHKGTAGAVDVQVNYRADEALPAGIASVVVATTAAGAGNPDLSDATMNFGDGRWDLIVTPYTADVEMDTLEAEVAGRWTASRQIDGYVIAAHRADALADATAYGRARNFRFGSVLDVGNTLSPPYEWAAAVAAQVALSGSADPARPFHTLALPGMVGAAIEKQRSHAERESLLNDGMATHVVDAGGVARIERLISTYQTAPSGEDDAAWLDANTALTLAWLRRDFRQVMRTKYGRHKLADDGNRADPGQPIITPSIGRAEAIAIFESWEARGLVENAEAFAEALVVQRHDQVRTRLDFALSPDLVNQLRVIGARISFIL